MPFRHSLLPLVISLLLVLALGAQVSQRQPKPLICGTSSAMARQEAFLHRTAATRRAALLRAGRAAITAPGGTLDLARSATAISGDILLMSTGAGVSIPRNPFPPALVGREIRFQPVDAAASAYRLMPPADGAYRNDAVLPPAVNLIQPGSPGSFADDDVREFSLPFPFPFYGKTYESVYVHSNGFVSFEEPSPSGGTLSYSDFLSGPPKIMGAGLDLDPSAGRGGAGLYVFLTDTEAIFSYVGIPQFISASTVDFQIRITSDGTIEMMHRRAPSGLFVMGITPGRNLGSSELISFSQPPSGSETGSIAEVFSDVSNGEIDIARAAQVFFETQPDDYDYVVFYNNLGIAPAPGVVAYEITVRNQVRGNGDHDTDRSAIFGSSGRLQAVLNMGTLSQYPDDPSGIVLAREGSEDTPLTVLAHEAGHRFLAFPLLEEPSGITRNLLGNDFVHWSFNFNSDGSFLEGNAVKSTGKLDEFITGAPTVHYSELDRYLMGLIGLDQVGIAQQLYYVDASTSRMRQPKRGQFLYGPARNFSIYNIIAANGPRIPDHTVSQKRFRFAFVLITSDATAPERDLAKLNAFRTGFESFFHEKTGGLAIADTSLKPALSADAFPATGLTPGVPGQLIVRRESASPSAVPLTISVAGAPLELPSSAEIAPGAVFATIPIAAASPGASAVTVSSADGSHLPDVVNVAVRAAAELRLEPLAGTRYQQPPDSSPISVAVRIADENRVPYQGIEVRLEALGGVARPPVLGYTNSSGIATLEWLPASVPELASVCVAANCPASAVTLTAVATLQPQIHSATNAASFTPGISPGSLATLFGLSLSSGETAAAQSQPLPTELAGARVTVNGESAQLLYASDLQINFAVPQALRGSNAVIVVETPSGRSIPFTAPLFAEDPAVFFDSGTNLGAVLRAGASNKTDVDPARPGGFVEIYATGLGRVLAGGRGGPWLTEKPVTATINGEEIPVVYAGIAPGFIGLYQVNALLPEALVPGTYSLRLQQAGRQSNAVNVIVGPPAAASAGRLRTTRLNR
ncbi:MAG: hypothetical protein LC114_11900 [Bryobacterales bacterium]|nr:hypothetical protein [Bryobacterales bacterium]